MVVALQAVASLVGLAIIAIGVLTLRRRLIRRRSGTFDCSLRLRHPQDPASLAAGGATDDGAADSGRGWVFGIGRYTDNAVEWYRMFSYATRPRMLLSRADFEVLNQRVPTGQEELALLPGWRVLECRCAGQPIELGMSDEALTGLLSWLEAAPPGQHMSVA